MRLRLVFWRHGQTVQNASMRIQGSQDFPLNDVGHAQAAVAAKELARMKPGWIYSSDLGRALQTAQYLADATGVEIRRDAGLRERAYGPWEGLTSAEIRARDPERWKAWREGREPKGVGVESREACGRRVHRAVERALSEVRRELAAGAAAGGDATGCGSSVRAAGEGGVASQDDVVTIVFVAHGGSIANGVMSMLGQNPSEWVGLQGMDNCHWSIIEPRPSANPVWRMRSYNLGASAGEPVCGLPYR